MKVTIQSQEVLDLDYTPKHSGDMNRFKITLSDPTGTAVVYLFSRRNAQHTKKLLNLLEKGNFISAELVIVQDPENRERNIAMISSNIQSVKPGSLQLSA